MQGSDYTVKNNKGYKPGENTLDARMYLIEHVASYQIHSSLRRRHLMCWERSRSRNWHRSTTTSISTIWKPSICTRQSDLTNTFKKISRKRKQKKMPMTSWNPLPSAISTQSTSMNGSSASVNFTYVIRKNSKSLSKIMMQQWLSKANSKLSTFDRIQHIIISPIITHFTTYNIVS